MNLSAFHKGHAAEGEGDLPIGPSGLSDDYSGRGRYEEDRGRRYEDEAPSRADDGDWRPSGGGRRPFSDRGDRPERGFGGGFRSRDEGSRADGEWRTTGGRGGFRDSGFDRDFGRGDVRADSRGDVRGDVRADMRDSSGRSAGYRPLQLKKKGESGEGTSEPARRSEVGRGDVRENVVKIHHTEEEKPVEPTKPKKGEPKVEETAKTTALDRALEDKGTVTVEDLSEGISALTLNQESKTQLSQVLVKSLVNTKLNLQEVVGVLQSKVPTESADLLVSVLQQCSAKKSDAFVRELAAGTDDLLEAVAPGKQGKDLEAFLADKGLSSLAPVPEINKWVSAALDEKQSLDAVLEHIRKHTDAKQTLPSLGALVAERMASLVFKDPAKPNLQAIDNFTKLLRRTVCQPQNDIRGQASVLFAVQNAWSEAKMPKAALKETFEKLYTDKLVIWEAFDAWREDRTNKTPNKPRALVQVNSWLESIKPKEQLEEDEGDEEEDEEEEDEE